MNTSFDDFYRNKNLSEFLDDDLILQFKDNNSQLQEFLLQNPDIVSQMLSFIEIDEFETDHKRIIKYPFMVSEILNSLFVLNDQHILFTLELLNNSTLPSITIGYISKILMNTLKNQPCKFWQLVQQRQIDTILQDINYELVYSMIIFQTQENQLEFLDKRTALVDYLINQINSSNSEGISNVLYMLLQQITDTLQEQKALIIKHIFTRTEDLIKILTSFPSAILNILTAMIKHEQFYETETNTIYNYFLNVQQQIREALLLHDDKFGLNNLAYLQFYDVITNSSYILTHINGQELVDLMIQLLQKYQYNNQLHKFASNIIIKLLPSIDNQKLLESLFLEINIKPIKPNRGYILKIINRIYELNISVQKDSQIDILNNINNNYLLGIVPDQKPTFNLQEEFEVAMNKLQI